MDYLLKLKNSKIRKTRRFKIKHIYWNEWDKACFQHDMAYRDFKDLAKKTAFDKVLKFKAFNIAKNDWFQRDLASMVYKGFNRMSRGSSVKNEMKQNEQLAEKTT